MPTVPPANRDDVQFHHSRDGSVLTVVNYTRAARCFSLKSLAEDCGREADGGVWIDVPAGGVARICWEPRPVWTVTRTADDN